MKKFYLSKTFYGLVLIFIGGGLQAVGMVELGSAVLGIGIGLAGYGRVTADKPLSF